VQVRMSLVSRVTRRPTGRAWKKERFNSTMWANMSCRRLCMARLPGPLEPSTEKVGHEPDEDHDQEGPRRAPDRRQPFLHRRLASTM